MFGVFCFCTVELKAEVEKLRAAQMSSQGVEPERVRLFQQEISALRNRLCQQEREMLEANRLVSQQKVTVYRNLHSFIEKKKKINLCSIFLIFFFLFC